VQNTTSSVTEILTNTKQDKLPIANSQLDKSFNPIANSQLVDRLLSDYSDLIEPTHVKWFAKRFYTLSFDAIHRAAGEAKADGKDPKRLFAFLIKKASTPSLA